jgi:hypothetical protein
MTSRYKYGDRAGAVSKRFTRLKKGAALWEAACLSLDPKDGRDAV